MRLGKKSRTIGPTIGRQTSLASNTSLGEEEEEPLGSEVMDGGVNTTDPAHVIPSTEFQLVEGFYSRDGKLVGIPGPTILTPTKPNSNRVLGLFNINRFSGTITHLRFTKSSLHRLNGGAWTAITGGALTGGDYDRFQLLFVEDMAFFNNNGLDVLQKINLGADTYAAAGNARKYKYYAVINNRIVGANLLAATNDPTEVAGSGDRNYSEWDPTVDISAFRGSLVEPRDSSIDDITGLANADNNLLVFRSRSIWLGIPQPIASTPFNFVKIDRRGCNAPYSIQQVRNGIIWYDPYLVDVFLYDFETRKISSVGGKIKRHLASSIGDVSRVFSSYDDYNNEYELATEISGIGGARVYRYNLDNKSWVWHLVPKATTLTNSVDSIPSITIDGLGSTEIDSLSGTIDELSTNAIVASKIFGTSDGERVALTTYFASSGITTIFKSKVFRIPGYKQHISRIEIDFETNAAVKLVFLVYFEKTFSYITKITQFTTPFGTLRIPINKTCREFAFYFSQQPFNNQIFPFDILAYRTYRTRAGKI